MEFAGKTILFTGAAGGLGTESALTFMRAGARVLCVDIDEAKIAHWRDGHGRSSRAVSRSSGWISATSQGSSAASPPGRARGQVRHRHQQRRDLPGQAVRGVHARRLPGRAAGQCRGRRGLRPGRPAGHARSGLGADRQRRQRHLLWRLGQSQPLRRLQGSPGRATRAWAREFGAYGITVNAIAPGAFPTDAEKIHPDPEGYTRFVLDHQAVKRRGRPDDIAQALLFLTSDRAGFITGQTLNVDGGWVMQ